MLYPFRATIRQIKNYALISGAPRFLLSSRFKRRQRIGIESPANGTRLVIAAGCLTAHNRTQAQRRETMPANCMEMMSGGGGLMMIGMGLIWIVVIVVLVLEAGALVKYLRSVPRKAQVV